MSFTYLGSFLWGSIPHIFIFSGFTLFPPAYLWCYGAPDGLSFIGTSSLWRCRVQCSCFCQASYHTYAYFKFLKILLISHLWHLFSFSPFPTGLSILDYSLTIMSVIFQAEVKITLRVLPSPMWTLLMSGLLLCIFLITIHLIPSTTV